MKHFFIGTILAVTLAACNSASEVITLAPMPIAKISPENSQGKIDVLKEPLGLGVHKVEILGAARLQLKFNASNLKTGQTVVIKGNDQEQSFNRDQLVSWDGMTAEFNSDVLTIEIFSENSEKVELTIEEINIATKGFMAEASENIPSGLTDIFGSEARKYFPSGALNVTESIKSICGNKDDRVKSSHALVGRIMPNGCTGWIISDGRFLTAGHCKGPQMRRLEFNVPISNSDGTIVASKIKDQYAIVSSSIDSVNGGIGNDWAIFNVAANTETSLMPEQAQGGHFRITNKLNPDTVRITGFGVDDGADNQVQQTDSGELVSNTVHSNTSATLKYRADSRGGNSGGPVITNGDNNTAIGIHSHAGCHVSGGENHGTSFRHKELWDKL